ncbi:MAG: SAM-dependent methyltransferase [Actinobacteria bacterium]|nr:SAM-dependent methyltransferase [Actinomycetota bacterium]NCZ61825.1 SAM-dependent methyltransferase [Actinomycetota bacterium]NDC17301.1 SAM-dependent methyltransferase [Actinomycetota bacterium]
MPQSIEQALEKACALILDTKTLVRVVLSGRRRNMQVEHERIDIRPVEIKGSIVLQLTYNDGKATTTKNIPADKSHVLELLCSGYANITIDNVGGTTSIRVTKSGEAQVHSENKTLEQNLSHDKKKERLLDPADPFLREVGIADHKGQIKPSKNDKYKQVEEFLRLLIPTLNSAIEAGQIAKPSKDKPLSIVDLGCGHAYLTFAAHQYLRSVGIPVQVTGIDVRPASRDRNNEIAAKLEITDTITFKAEEIASTTVNKVDVAIALHACDTATDDAIAWAVNGGAKLLLIAPCCHHDIQKQMNQSPEPWGAITKFGLMKERMGDLLTDALRAQILRIVGYRVEIIEFIGGEHTPRNIMIRAVKTGAQPDALDIDRYREITAQWGVVPALSKKISTFTIG